MKPFLIIKAGSRFKDPSLRSDFDDWMIRGLAVDPSDVWVVAVYEDEPLPDHSDVAGVVVTGSHAMVTDREDWSERTAAWLRDGVQKETPILGVCYGHQLLAHGLGGTVGDHPLGQELGTVDVVVNKTGQKDRLIGQLPERFSAQASHRQSVLVLPEGARCRARGCMCWICFSPLQAIPR
ncbi:MAG: glutamine amidotransferase [bacterium]|nr:glutamine amidotransferase [bacterium]